MLLPWYGYIFVGERELCNASKQWLFAAKFEPGNNNKTLSFLFALGAIPCGTQF